MRGYTSPIGRQNDNRAPDHIPDDFRNVFQLEFGTEHVARQEIQLVSLVHKY